MGMTNIPFDGEQQRQIFIIKDVVEDKEKITTELYTQRELLLQDWMHQTQEWYAYPWWMRIFHRNPVGTFEEFERKWKEAP